LTQTLRAFSVVRKLSALSFDAVVETAQIKIGEHKKTGTKPAHQTLTISVKPLHYPSGL